MARAETLTWLPLDRWAQLVSLDPFHFNQITTTFRPDSACNSGEDIWRQWAWQDAAKVSREDLAEAIAEAERIIAGYVGYNLLPDWTLDERRQTTRPPFRELFSTGVNVRGLAKSVTAKRGYTLSGGVRAKSLISAGAAIVRSDGDGDGYQETCTVTVVSTIDTEEVRVYFPGQSGADEWELRPVQVVASGANIVVTFKIWQVPLPNQWNALNASVIDGDVPANFETTIDVYRVYNDPQTQVSMLWEPDGGSSCGCGAATCTACTFAAQTGCLHVRDTRTGILAYSPAEWDAANGVFNASQYALCREPDRLRLWYYSGWRWETNDSRKRATVDMDPYWERPVAYLALALLQRDICGCNNTGRFMDFYREDLARNGKEVSYQTAPELIGNAFGTTRGGWYAWQRAKAEGRRVQP